MVKALRQDDTRLLIRLRDLSPVGPRGYRSSF